MSWTPATPIGPPSGLFAGSTPTKAAHSAQFWCSASPLDATLPGTLVCAANKGLRKKCKSFKCNTYKKQGGAQLWLTSSFLASAIRRSNVPTRNHLSPLFSYSCAYSDTTAPAQLFSNQQIG